MRFTRTSASIEVVRCSQCYCFARSHSRFKMKELSVVMATLLFVAGTEPAEVKSECKDNFLYFAYGSNLLEERIRINNPSAQFVGVAKLQNFRLDFVVNASLWRGAVATVVEHEDREVWGALWKLNCSNMASLDKQEGVDINWYIPRQVHVNTPGGETLRARTYQQVDRPRPLTSHDYIPVARRPSITYLKVILLGAMQCGLPMDYITYLYSIQHNGQDASPEILRRMTDLAAVSLYPDHFVSKTHHYNSYATPVRASAGLEPMGEFINYVG